MLIFEYPIKIERYRFPAFTLLSYELTFVDGAAAIIFGTTFFGFFASRLLRFESLAMLIDPSDCRKKVYHFCIGKSVASLIDAAAG